MAEAESLDKNAQKMLYYKVYISPLKKWGQSDA